MIALIFAAGRGKRLRPRTFFVPKPLITIGKKPCIGHIIDDFREQGINEILVNIHYKPMSFMKSLGDQVHFLYERELKGEENTLMDLPRLVPHVMESYLVVRNGDTLSNVKIAEMMRMAGGRSVRHMDKGVYAGTMILSPSFFMGDRDVVDYEDFNSWWIDMGTPKGLEEARRYEKLNYLP